MSGDEESGPAISSQIEAQIIERTENPTGGPRAIFEDLPELDQLWTVLASGLELFLAFVEFGFAVVHKKKASWYIPFVLYVIAPC